MTQDQRRTLFEPDPLIEVPPHVAAVVHPVPVPPPAPSPEPTPVVEPEQPVTRRRNPWVVALWVASAVLVVLGVWASTSAIAGQYRGYSGINGEDFWSQPEFILEATKTAFAPGIFTIGLACALAAAVIQALQWMRRHP